MENGKQRTPYCQISGKQFAERKKRDPYLPLPSIWINPKDKKLIKEFCHFWRQNEDYFLEYYCALSSQQQKSAQRLLELCIKQCQRQYFEYFFETIILRLLFKGVKSISQRKQPQAQVIGENLQKNSEEKNQLVTTPFLESITKCFSSFIQFPQRKQDRSGLKEKDD